MTDEQQQRYREEIEIERQKQRDEVTEHIDDDPTILSKSKILAEFIKHSSFFTAFTGAGISTSAGNANHQGEHLPLQASQIIEDHKVGGL